jgi:DNA polymerase-3 subunit delta'
MFSFNDVIGQSVIKQHLLQEVQEGRVAHAQLFAGQQGVGKLPLALAFARYLCCPNRTESDACDTCPSCVKWKKLVHPDVHFIFPYYKHKQGDSCDTYLPQWRELLTETTYFSLADWQNQLNLERQQTIIYEKESDNILRKLSLKSVEGEYKICIIWQAERMNVSFANKLLKMLEEPPAGTIFLLLSDTPDKLLTTIRSRCQRIEIPKVEEPEIAEALQQRLGILQNESTSIAHLANGNFTRALEAIRTDSESREFLELFINLMRLSYQRKIREMKQWSETLAEMGRERQKRFLAYAQHMLRENFILNFHQAEMNYMTIPEENFSIRFAPFINERNVFGLMNELSEAELHIEQNVNAKMVFFDFALKMIVLLKQ